MEDANFQYFNAFDYVVFGITLVISSLIGIYHAFVSKKKQNTTFEYLLGGKEISVFPMAMSLIASFISGIALVAMPTEIYTFGTKYWIIAITPLMVSFFTVVAVIPVFFRLDIGFSYEYLKLRFDARVRTFAATLFVFKMLLFISIAMYLPSLAFAQVSGLNIYAVIAIVCTVCTFYTALGGLKAVVWTDTLQIIFMAAAVVAIVVIGVNNAGVHNVWQRGLEGDRIEFFNMSWDPTIQTFWGVLIGEFFHYLASATSNQATVQRCLAMPSLKKARITMSTGLNSMTGIILEDFIKPLWRKPLSNDRASFIMKVVTTILGEINKSAWNNVRNVARYWLGMFFPWANTTGTFAGGFISTALVAWMSFGRQLAIYRKQLIYPTKPVSVHGCYNDFITSSSNETIVHIPLEETKELFLPYRISHHYYTFYGTVTVILVGMIVSYFTKFNDPKKMNPDVFSILIQPLLRSKSKAMQTVRKDEGERSFDHSSQLQPFLEEESNVRRGRNTIHISRG